MITLHPEFFPDEPSTEDWEPLIREAIEAAEDPQHVTVTHSAITLTMHYCTYPDRTPIWDAPLVGSSATLTATRADGETMDMSMQDGHGWDTLATALDEFMDGWGTIVMETLSAVKTYDDEIRQLEKQLTKLKAKRKQSAVSAHRKGVSQYRIAQVMGRVQSSVQTWFK